MWLSFPFGLRFSSHTAMLRVPQLEDPIAIIALACRDIPARRSTYMRLDIRLSVFSTRKAIGRHTRRDFSNPLMYRTSSPTVLPPVTRTGSLV